MSFECIYGTRCHSPFAICTWNDFDDSTHSTEQQPRNAMPICHRAFDSFRGKGGAESRRPQLESWTRCSFLFDSRFCRPYSQCTGTGTQMHSFVVYNFCTFFLPLVDTHIIHTQTILLYAYACLVFSILLLLTFTQSTARLLRKSQSRTGERGKKWNVRLCRCRQRARAGRRKEQVNNRMKGGKIFCGRLCLFLPQLKSLRTSIQRRPASSSSSSP